MPRYLATLGDHYAAVDAPDERTARVNAVWFFREHVARWWRAGVVRLRELPVHTCSCGETYTLAEWRSLPLCGVQSLYPEPGEAPALELRDCPCGSTRGLEIDEHGEPWSDRPTAI